MALKDHYTNIQIDEKPYPFSQAILESLGMVAPSLFIDAKLMEKHKVHCVSMILEKVNGVRIAPNVYTNTQDLDILVKGLTEISKMDPPPAPPK